METPVAADRALIAPVRDRATFGRLRTAGRRVRQGPVKVTWVPAEADDAQARVSYAITRRVGGAVVRNRVRRRLRAVTHELESQLRPGAYLMTAGSEAATMPYDQLRASVQLALDGLFKGSGAPEGRSSPRSHATERRAE